MRTDRIRRRGFSLIELTMSILILTILVTAIGSALTLALNATNSAAVQAKKTDRTAELTDQLSADLSVATNFTERSANAVTFTVPDRDGDGLPDVLRYALAGTDLTRSYQNGAASAIAGDVQLFNLSFTERLRAPAPPSEILIASFDSTALGSAQDFQVDAGDWVSQYFTPTLPAGATTWSISRLRLRVDSESSNNNGILYVQIRTATVNKAPTNTVLAQQLLFENAMTASYSWIDIPFTGINLSASQGASIVMGRKYGSGRIANVSYQDYNKTLMPGFYYTDSSNSGSTWQTPTDSRTLRFYIYGTAQ